MPVPKSPSYHETPIKSFLRKVRQFGVAKRAPSQVLARQNPILFVFIRRPTVNFALPPKPVHATSTFIFRPF